MEAKSEPKIKLEKKLFIQQSKKIQEHYLIDEDNLLWQGETGVLAKCLHKATKTERAVKIVFKYLLQDFDMFIEEIQKLKELVLLIP